MEDFRPYQSPQGAHEYRIIAEDRQPDENMPTRDDSLAEQVGRLEQKYAQIKDLCGGMIATLLVDGNKNVFAGLPPEWHDIVAAWKRRWDALKTVSS